MSEIGWTTTEPTEPGYYFVDTSDTKQFKHKPIGRLWAGVWTGTGSEIRQERGLWPDGTKFKRVSEESSDDLGLLLDCWMQWAYRCEDGRLISGRRSTLEQLYERLLDAGLIGEDGKAV